MSNDKTTQVLKYIGLGIVWIVCLGLAWIVMLGAFDHLIRRFLDS